MFEKNCSRKPKYTDERNAQILIYLMKTHGIKRVVASPGMTNVCLMASLQSDPYFTIYSAPDERSAAYIACGISQETNETVALSCTGATSSRNYYPGLTEAFYSKLPILVITSSRRSDRIGHNFDQVTDRSCPPKDVAKISVLAPYIKDKEDEWACEIAVNKALLELRHHGNGPVHINLETMYSTNRNVTTLPSTRVINRYIKCDCLPELNVGRIAIVVGGHAVWTDALVCAVEEFCEKYDAAVFCDQISNYGGKYKVFPNIVTTQRNGDFNCKKADVIIHIGNISSSEYGIEAKEVWRVNPDGEIRDTFWRLTNVFEMEEIDFFSFYNDSKPTVAEMEFYEKCRLEEEELLDSIPELPFSNIWMAQQLSSRLPDDSILQLGIRNSLRSWNYFRTSGRISCFSNTGGFGIDGSLSTVLGNSLSSHKNCYCILGDLAFFYDMNALGNRHINSRVRILLVNNGTGMEMKFSYSLPSVLDADKDGYIAASGHYGKQSHDLVRHYAEDLGFLYLSANNKQEYMDRMEIFLSEEYSDKPIVFETFVSEEDEDTAYNLISEIKGSSKEKSVIYNDLPVPKRNENYSRTNIVAFGAGPYFMSRLDDVCGKAEVKYVCDNDSSKWGSEIAPGIVCISPMELKEMQDVFVIVTCADPAVAMQISFQLMEMGIEQFDHVNNWVRYMSE